MKRFERRFRGKRPARAGAGARRYGSLNNRDRASAAPWLQPMKPLLLPPLCITEDRICQEDYRFLPECWRLTLLPPPAAPCQGKPCNGAGLCPPSAPRGAWRSPWETLPAACHPRLPEALHRSLTCRRQDKCQGSSHVLRLLWVRGKPPPPSCQPGGHTTSAHAPRRPARQGRWRTGRAGGRQGSRPGAGSAGHPCAARRS